MRNVKQVANNFYDWLIEHGYSKEADKEYDIDYVIEDLAAAKESAPRLYNLLADLCDR